VRAFSREAKELATVPNRPFSFSIVARERAPQHPRKPSTGDKIAGVTYAYFHTHRCPRAGTHTGSKFAVFLANLPAWLEFAPSRNPDAFSSHFHPAG